jgi:uncharacterized protein YkwD
MGTGVIIAIVAAAIGVTFFFVIRKGKKNKEDGVPLNPSANDMISYTPTPSKLTIFETDFFNLLNEYRLSNNLKILETDTHSRYLCIEHNKYMIEDNVINHNNAFRRSFEMKRRGAKDVGEIVARNFTKAQSFFNGYLNSPLHKAEIDTPEYTHIGIKFLKDSNGKYYNTCIFTKF